MLDRERLEGRRGRPAHKPIDEEACEEQYEGCIFFGAKILDWRLVILKPPSVTSLRVTLALAF